MRGAWLLVAAVVAPSVLAQEPPALDAGQWLQKMYSASRKLSFSGTFIYQHGAFMETSRIARSVNGATSQERVEVLEGTPREIMRTNDDVTCYLPGSMTVKVEKAVVARPFPGLVADDMKDIAAHYTVRKGDLWRVAGHACQSILLEPKDGFRYGQRLCADTATGMLLKAQTLSEKGEVLEQFAFTQIRIGGVERSDLKSRFAGKGQDWRFEHADMSPASFADLGWTLKTVPEGFRRVTEVKRRIGGSPDVGQIVLSDGLSAVSVFIEPAANRSVRQLGPARQGATSIYTRKVDDYIITVVGEVPAESARVIAQGVEYRKPN
ncbi:MAG: MucB/RseB C-terminal domain-containing protein [Burkholderiales bacterium]|jgi:sigma-E factor negative regulatory protein RseB|nr:MucB/RseB C-terminal domain-containing protein [Burkholderiales bacterium]